MMDDRNSTDGIISRDVDRHGKDEQIEKATGEFAFDLYVKAQASAPEVVKRITELENCLLRLVNAIFASSDSELRTLAEEAKLILKNRLEVDDTKLTAPTRSKLGPFSDELRIIGR